MQGRIRDNSGKTRQQVQKMLSAKLFFVPAIPRRNPKTSLNWLHPYLIKKNKLFTANGPAELQEKQRRNHASKEEKNTVLESEFTSEKWAYLIQSIATTAHKSETRGSKRCKRISERHANQEPETGLLKHRARHGSQDSKT